MLITPEMVQAARERLQVPVVLIEEDDAESIIIDSTVSQLQGILAQLDALAPLPKAGSPEALANHAAWMAQSEQMSQLDYQAKCVWLVTVPNEVKDVLHAISTRHLVLMGIIRDPDESSEDRLERQAQAHLETTALHRDDPIF